ncbi:plasmid partition ParA protein [Klebsiella michiganensis]|nr:plasmid partition ParA protein [Klebsiella michiganensis]
MNSCLYQGVLRHRRLQPKAHHFRYRIFMAWLDLDELDRLGEAGIRRNRFAAASFYDADYPLGTPLKAQVLNRLESLTGARPDGRVMLLTQLRYLGFHFNPVNFYYCYDGAGTLRWVLAEVRNTPWNERHYYAVDGHGRARWRKPFTSRRLTRWIWSTSGALTVPVKRCTCISRTIRPRKSSTPRWP